MKIQNQDKENLNMVENNNEKENFNMEENNNEEVMNKRLNLLFIEGNRQKIDTDNVKEAYFKIKEYGFIKSMPLEYVPMEEAKEKIGNKFLFKATVIRKRGKGEPTISNFEIKSEVVNPEDYGNYDGVCVDGQHRILALLFSDLEQQEVTYVKAEIPQKMDILAYVAMRNNGKAWKNNDFTHSGITTDNEEIDHILEQCKNSKVEDAFLYSIYTLDTCTLNAKHVKALQQGYRKTGDFKKLHLSPATTEMGDRVFEAIRNNGTLASDRCTGRLGAALKKFYLNNGKNIEILLNTITLIDNTIWETYFTPEKGHSMEAKAYEEALQSVWEQYQGNA